MVQLRFTDGQWTEELHH
ncbi:hypothetical protein D043_4184A, partial [Vibrio parahaemolyticus EKP-021]